MGKIRARNLVSREIGLLAISSLIVPQRDERFSARTKIWGESRKVYRG